MRQAWLATMALALTGCAGMQHAMDHYSGIEPVEVQMPDDRYRVFDKPTDGRMMVTSSIGSAAGQGMGSGLMLGMVDTTPPLPHFQAAAEAHLVATGRAQCRVTQGYIVIKPQFEFRYTCEPATLALPPRAAAPGSIPPTSAQPGR
jgi:hypothetical protein